MSSSRPISRTSLDGRTDLGYGRSNSTYHIQRNSNINFPYHDNFEDVSDIKVKEETEEALDIKINNIMPYDSLSHKKRDGGHYVDANSILRKVESIAASNSLSPIPNLYKNKAGVSGGHSTISTNAPTSGFTTRVKYTGDKRGWSSAPKDIWNEDEELYIYNLENSTDEVLREYIRIFLIENYE